MLDIIAPVRNAAGACSRRDLLRVGALGLGGLTLPWWLQAQASAAEGSVRPKSVVLLFLGGGPSHIETFNPNMDQPGPGRSLTGDVKTNLPGVAFGGTFPGLAKHADKMAIVRSFHHTDSNHSTAVPYVLSGGKSFSGGIGSVYARLRGTNDPRSGLPTTSLITAPDVGRFANARKRVIQGSQPGDLGAPYAPFQPDGEGPAISNMTLNMPHGRLDDRRNLLAGLDRLRRDVDASGAKEGFDRFRQQAYDVILGSAAKTFDLSQEDPRLVAQYDTSMFRVGESEFRSCSLGSQMLMARRLVEAGCGFITVQNAGWDMHASSGNNNMSLASGMRMLGGPLDKAVSAFLADLDQRGLLDQTLLVITGEFGRTPRVNKNGGRDHWANLSTLALAGGGLQMGQVIGQSAPQNDLPASEPIRVENLMSTVMHTLFDVGKLRVDRTAPRTLLDPIERHAPITELF
ncbi:DUF1501 domain-containing protein [Lignipirellula cremea]|uniref:DUF1501 domain-containing protein n=1 Tax=Lignipirellula cremea TaxID=2528010 RepID=A0A518DSV3_9BACT|nr:DUF1501 domain-containing protein [Lignipirellula cremea]QDU94920.1 hypothetical protein Pla8534_27280 [Lignipirellula cremea]